MKKSKLFCCAIVVALLCGCTPSSQDVTKSFNIPPELKGYHVVRLNDENGVVLYTLVKSKDEDREVVGTMLSGKNPIHTIVIDGKEYVEKQ